VKTTLRVKRDRVKEDIFVAREYLNIVLQSEDVAEFDYKPTQKWIQDSLGKTLTARRNAAYKESRPKKCDHVLSAA